MAQSTIVAPYRAFSREKLPARIGAHIGLMHINITLTALPLGNWTPPDIDFNERFSWNQANDMGNSYRDALQRGLPYPILTVAEYFSLGQEGFAWGGQYRAAGYYASILLWYCSVRDARNIQFGVTFNLYCFHFLGHRLPRGS